jgi:hypothetical protein
MDFHTFSAQDIQWSQNPARFEKVVMNKTFYLRAKSLTGQLRLSLLVDNNKQEFQVSNFLPVAMKNQQRL